MLHRSFKPAKCKTSLKLATSRIKLLKNKKEVQLKQLKRELAQLLESGQDQTARIRVEHVVREEKMMAAYDLLDIYCELIVARLPIIESQKNCPIDMKEAVTSVIFASPRCADIPELQDVRKHLTSKYGKEFVNVALELRPECGVSRMLVEKLSAKAPDGQTKIKILTSIAEEHNVKWDPKSFGEKELKPPDDLLNGPNTFDKASKMHLEPPIVQAPPSNIQAPQDHDQNQGAPVNYQQNPQSSTSSHNFAFTGISESQSTTPAAPHPPVRHSGTEYERTEVRHSYSRDENAFSMGKQNWNMEFKDATAAAQAAAESAERASMAARAAAELSSHGKITRQYSTESHNSNADSLRNDKPQKINTSKLPAEKIGKNVPCNVSYDRNQNLHTQTEEVDRYGHEVHYEADERFYDDHGSTKRFGQSASLRSGQASIDDQSSMNNLHEVDRYSRKGSFEKEAVKSEKSASLSAMRANEQSIGQAGLQSDNSDYFGGRIRKQDSNNYSRSNSANYGNDNNFSPPRYQNIVFDVSKDPSVGIYHGNSHRETVESGNTGTADVVFDSYGSDDDEINFDGQPLCDEHESNLNFASLNKEPSKKNMSGPSEKPFSVSHVSAEWFSPPKLGESFTKTPSSAQLDDLVPATFDSGPSSDSEDGFNLSSFHGKTDPGIPSNKENNFFRNSDDISGDHGLKGSFFTEKADSGSSRKQNLHSYYDDDEFVEVTAQHKHGEEFGSKSQTKFGFDEMPSPRSSSVRQNAQITSNDMTRRLSPQSSRLSSFNEVKDTDDMCTSVSTDSIRNEQSFDQSRSESGKELNLASLPGGLRNKGYKHPPYTKISLGNASTSKGDASTSKGAAEDNMTFSEKSPASPTVENSLNSRASPQVKARTEIKKHDLSRDDFKEELPQQNLRNKQEPFFTKVDNTKSKFSAPATYFDSDDDFEEDLPKQTSTNKVRAGSGFSRRTKANLVSERSSFSKTKVGSAASESSVSVSKNKLENSENRPKLMPQTEKHSTIQPIGEENQKSSTMEQPSSPLKTETSSSTGTSKTSSGEAPSRESSLKKASHVHPKLPDYDSIAAQLQSLRQNRR